MTIRAYFVKQYGQIDEILTFEYAPAVDLSRFKTPGQLLKALLEDKGWKQSTLAAILNVDRAIVVRLMADKRPMDAGTALRLEGIFGIPAEDFLDLQKQYELAVARVVEQPDLGLDTRAKLFSALPVAEMIKRGWLDATDIRDIPKVEASLAKFFGVDSIDEIEVLPHAAKKTNVGDDVTPAQLAWFHRVRQLAEVTMAPRYVPMAGNKAVRRLQDLLAAAEEARHAPRILAEAGIRLVIVESLSTAKIDGVCFWLNDFAPVIGLSLRFDRIDNFWFVLRHEIEHVLRRHGRVVAMIDAELEGARAGTGDQIVEEERIANDAAADFCVPRAKMEKFVRVKAPFYAERDILGFAKTLNVHPGLVAGQLQHKTEKYDRFRDHLVRIRSIVTPGAMVDGWGDVAPIGE